MNPAEIKTHCLDILLKCRKGLGLTTAEVRSVYYTANSLVMLFRPRTDNQIYRIEISVLNEGTKGEL